MNFETVYASYTQLWFRIRPEFTALKQVLGKLRIKVMTAGKGDPGAGQIVLILACKLVLCENERVIEEIA